MPVPPPQYNDLRYEGDYWKQVPQRLLWENDSTNAGDISTEAILSTYTIPANTFGAAGNTGARYICGGQSYRYFVRTIIQNNTAGSLNYTMRCKLNGTSVLGTSTMALPQSASERCAEWEWFLHLDNDFNLNQRASFRVSGLMAPPTATDDAFNRLIYTRGSSTVEADWASDMVLAISGQWSGTGTVAQQVHQQHVDRWMTFPG